MKALMRGFGLLLLGMILMGSTGCGVDNDSEAEKLQKSSGPPPPLPEGSTSSSTPSYSSYDDYAKSQAQKKPYGGEKNSPNKKK